MKSIKALELKKDIYWVGALDPDLRIFDIIMYTPFGTTYNSYVVKGSEKTAVFETVKVQFFDEYIERLRSLDIEVEKIDYIVVDHTEPDHAGSVAKLLDIAKDAKVVGSSNAIRFLKSITNRDFDFITVSDNDTLSLGNKTLKFISAPFLHWPDSIYTYVVEDSTLITCDSFGSHYCNELVFNDLNSSEKDYMEALKYYFDCIMGPFKPHVLKAYDKIKDLKIDIICPGHGPVLRENPWKIVDLYKKWSTPESIENDCNNITICYVSAYGYTEEISNKISEGIRSVGDFNVDMYNIIHSDIDEIMNKIDKADGILFGSPTINGDALKPVLDILTNLNPLVHGNKVAGAFGSYGWSGEAVPNIERRLKELRMNILPGLKVNFKPSETELESAFKFGESFAEKIKEKLNKGVKPVKKSTTKKWKCIVCSQIFEGVEPPEICPACGASQDQFIEIKDETITFTTDKHENYVIIGNGASGYYAAEAIRKRNVNCNINIISSEKYLTYYRPVISDYLSTNVPDEEFYISPEKWYKDNNITLTLNTYVNKVTPTEKKVSLSNGNEVFYDKLIFANGSSGFVPPIKGSNKNNVFTLRTKDDADLIKSKINNVKTAVIIGGGLLGLEAAWELKKSGLNVIVVEVANRLLPMQLDEEAADIFKSNADKSGVTILLNECTEEIIGEDSVKSVKLKSGKIIDADLVLFSTGIRPNKFIAESIGIASNRGIIVNEKMETNILDIYACGDVAELNGRVYGNWPAAIEMGKIAGANAVGDTLIFEDFISSTAFNAMNSEIFSCGDISSESLTKISLNDASKGIYKKLFFKNNRLVGAILMGNTKQAVKIMSSIQQGKLMTDII